MNKKHLVLIHSFACSLSLLGCSSSLQMLEPASGNRSTVSSKTATLSVHAALPHHIPEEVLERTTPVFVRVKNEGTATIKLSPLAFVVTANGQTVAPVYSPPFQETPARLEQTTPSSAKPSSETVAPTSPSSDTPSTSNDQTTASLDFQDYHGPAFNGVVGHRLDSVIARGPIVIRSAPVYGGGYRGGYYGGGYRGGYRGGYYGGGYRGGYYGPRSYRTTYPVWSPYYHNWYGGYYGWPYAYGAWGVSSPWYGVYGWPRNDYVAYTRGQDEPEQESIEEVLERTSLPAMNLPPGKEASGLIYFPRLSVPAGTSLTLIWTVQDQDGKTLETLRVPVILDNIEED